MINNFQMILYLLASCLFASSLSTARAQSLQNQAPQSPPTMIYQNIFYYHQNLIDPPEIYVMGASLGQQRMDNGTVYQTSRCKSH